VDLADGALAELIANPSETMELIERHEARLGLASYVAYCGLGHRPAKHHQLWIEALEAVERGECLKLMGMMPPGSAKSFWTSATFPAWYLGKHPTDSVIAGGHTQELADRFGRRVRNLYASPEHRAVFGVGVAGDSHAAGRWDTERGGEYFAVGIDGTVPGRRADLGIIDDPVKSREDADSERRRQHAWDWYLNDFLPRLKPGARQIVISTRWHEDDLVGRILEREGEQWTVIELAMEALPGDPLGRAVGERLWPEWFTEDQVATAKLDVRGWNALYQQRPASEEGDYFKLDWFGEWDAATLPEALLVYGASDYAVTDGGGDYTEHGIFGVDPWSNVYVLAWWRGQSAPDRWIEHQCDLVIEHKPLCWFGESGPIRRSVEPFLLKRMSERHAFCWIEWLPSIADKPTRCRSFQAMASMGKVFLPRMAAWRSELLGQLSRFPAGKYDDGVDVCSLMGRGLEHVRVPKIAPVRPMRPLEIGGSNLSWLGA
jgi:predicted phage terminase large subunit-like protein